MRKLKGGEFLLDLTSLGNLNDLSVGESTSNIEWDIKNMLPLNSTELDSIFLSKIYIVKVYIYNCIRTLYLTSYDGINSADRFYLHIFGYQAFQEEYDIIFDFANSVDALINPLINVTRTI